MRKNLFFGIVFMMLFLFGGITNVNAKQETCTFWLDGRNTKQYYIIEIDGGQFKKATYLKVAQRTNTVQETVDKTNDVTIRFSTCASLEYYDFDGHTYTNMSSLYVDGDWRKGLKNATSNSNSSNTGTGNSTTPEWLKGKKISCGNIGQIPAKAPELVHMFILIAQIAVPIILVILGMIDFAKGIMSQKEDEIKKGQKTFISRLIMGAVIFFIVAFVKLLIGIVVDNSNNRQNIIACIDCFVNNDCN